MKTKSTIFFVFAMMFLLTSYVNAQVNNFPWKEGFNAETKPSNWVIEYVYYNEAIGSPTDWEFKSQADFDKSFPAAQINAVEGSHFAICVRNGQANNGNITKFISPKLDLSSLNIPMLTFYFTNKERGNVDELKLYYRTSASGEWVQFNETYNTSIEEWTKVTVELPNKSDSYYIAFEAKVNGGFGVMIDDVIVREKGTGNDITEFSFAEQTKTADIDAENHTVDIEVKYNTNLSALVPTIKTSDHATISPESGVAQDFSSPKEYIVTSEVGGEQKWTVNVSVAQTQNTENDITSFTFEDITISSNIDNATHTVNITVAWYANIRLLTPTIEISNLASIFPESGIPQNFNQPLTYNVTADDGTIQNWTVYVTTAASPSPGGNCKNPVIVDFSTDLPYTDTDRTTYNLRNVYDNLSCTGYNRSLTGSQDIIYRLDVDVPISVNIAVETPESSTFLLLMSGCPDSYDAQCIKHSFGGISTKNHNFDVTLSSGAYYLLVDKWKGSTDYITKFTLTITDTCRVPVDVNVENLKATTADVKWTGVGIEKKWNIKVSTTSIDPENDVADIVDEEVSKSEYQLTNLTENTDYFVYVQADCGSVWTEEYKFTTTGSCPTPTNLEYNKDDIRANKAELSWATYGGEKWNIIVSKTQISNPQASDITHHDITTNPFTVTELDAQTIYYYYIQTVCDGEFSEWSAEGTFTTPCEILSLPIHEGFNDVDFPNCWSQQTSVNTEVTLTGTTSRASLYEGDGMLEFVCNYGNSGRTAKLISVPFSTEGIPSVDIEFLWYHKGGNPSDYLTEGVQVQYSLDGENWVDIGNIIRRYGETDGWAPKKLNLPSEANNKERVFIGFQFKSNGGANCYMDAISIVPTPNCERVPNLNLVSHASSTIDISWTESPSNPTGGYDIYCSTSEEFPADNTTPTESVEQGITTHKLEDLTPGTTYHIWVRANCGGTDVSFWNTFPLTVTTECAPMTLPITEGFNTEGYKTFPACWKQEFVNGTKDITFETSSSTPMATPIEGTRMVKWDSGAFGTSGRSTRLVSTPISTKETEDIEISFSWYQSYLEGDSYSTEGVTVQYSLDGNNWVTIQFIGRQNQETGWNDKAVKLPAAAENKEKVYIGFLFNSNAGYNCYMDNVKISPVVLETLSEIDVNNDVKEVSVCDGTSEETIKTEELAQTIQIKTEEGNTYSVNLSWTITSFEPNTPDVYDAVGTFKLPTTIIQPETPIDLKVETTVTVMSLPEITCPGTLLVDYNSITNLEGLATPIGGEYIGDNVVRNRFNAYGLEPGETQTVTYTYTDETTNCENSCDFVVGISAGINNITESDFNIFPNPNNGSFTLNLNNIEKNAKLMITDIKGSIIYESTIATNSNTKEISIDANSGFYIVKVITPKETVVKKLIIE